VWILRGIILLIGVIALVWLGMLNADQKVEAFRLFNWTFNGLPVNVIIVVSFLVGMLVWAVGGWIREAQLLLRVSREKKNCRRLQDEIEALRNLPLEEETGGISPEDMP
jgi:uncharacterized integral membrane protein